MKQTIAKDIPLAEITLRKYEDPKNLFGREYVRKLCLSIGLLQPGDSRDIIVDILHVLLRERRQLSLPEIEQMIVAERKKATLQLLGVAQSNIRRQLRRLRELFLVEKVRNAYRITENEHLGDLFEQKIQKYYLESIVSRARQDFFRGL